MSATYNSATLQDLSHKLHRSSLEYSRPRTNEGLRFRDFDDYVDEFNRRRDSGLSRHGNGEPFASARGGEYWPRAYDHLSARRRSLSPRGNHVTNGRFSVREPGDFSGADRRNMFHEDFGDYYGNPSNETHTRRFGEPPVGYMAQQRTHRSHSPRVQRGDMKEEVRAYVSTLLMRHFIEAFEEFYSDDVIMSDNGLSERVGKRECRSHLLRFLDSVVSWHDVRVRNVIVGNGKAVIELLYDITFRSGRRVIQKQALVQKWRNGKIAHETAYHTV
eukprot:comp19838_c0_seq1/m.38438 comp19838_c0_seq1/g.38438  ORF comp19838_c0_seq1/g.38438 comp19838_c0_seq1/m.38438 type:complete len:274 (-) comp19838_c0_seq1:15-836(-)